MQPTETSCCCRRYPPGRSGCLLQGDASRSRRRSMTTSVHFSNVRAPSSPRSRLLSRPQPQHSRERRPPIRQIECSSQRRRLTARASSREIRVFSPTLVRRAIFAASLVREPLINPLYPAPRAFSPQIEERGGSIAGALCDRRSDNEMWRKRRCPLGLRPEGSSALLPARSQTAKEYASSRSPSIRTLGATNAGCMGLIRGSLAVLGRVLRKDELAPR